LGGFDLTSVKEILECFLGIVGESPDYFVSGSLSFLPLGPCYREPKHDVDVGVSVELFEQRKAMFEAAGRVHTLRLSEVAIADTSGPARLFAPRTKFVHINTPAGLIDLSQFRVRDDFVELFLGAGLTLAMPSYLLERIRVLEWEGFRFRAAPPELSLVPKVLWYFAWKESGSAPNADEEKHLLDLSHAHSLIDWDFAESVLADSGFYWFGRRFPKLVDRALNPFRKLDVARARDELARLAAQQADEADVE
jgi:hypothetical protein